MTDASLELQGALVEILKGDAGVGEIIGDRIYDAVPRDPLGKVTARYPYASFGPEQTIAEDFDCIRSSQHILQIDAWSRSVGFPEVKRLANAIRLAIQGADLRLTDNALVSISYDGRRVFRDPDGVTAHAALTFTALVEHDHD